MSPADDALYRPNVGIMLLNRIGRAFVAKRIDFPGDAWQMPQGGIDEGEDPRRAALRELEEEIGTTKAELLAESRDWFRYDLPAELQGKLWSGKWKGQRQKWFAMRFTGADADIDIATAHPEFSAWRWVDPGQVPLLIIPFKRAIYERVVEEFRPHWERRP
jgi:putative (di)nucleoside polyphosphate hydrolase